MVGGGVWPNLKRKSETEKLKIAIFITGKQVYFEKYSWFPVIKMCVNNGNQVYSKTGKWNGEVGNSIF